MVDSAYYRGEALCEFKYLVRGGDNRVALGVMLQGNTVKVSAEVGEVSSYSVREIADALMTPAVGKRVWFDLAIPSSEQKELPINGFNRYGKTCLYRCKKIDRTSPGDVIRLFESYARLIRKKASVIRKQLDAACKAE
jgi:hypothetical protein